jgi:hypothetical protein
MSDQTDPAATGSGPIDVIAFFFGPEVDAADPVSLFRLEGEGPWPDAQIVQGLKSRLDQLNAHPHRATPQADEVRFALHAAAAKMLTAPKPEPAASEAPVRSPSPSPSPDASAMPPELRQQVLRLVASGGGWSRETMQRVTALAASRGIDPATLATWLSRLQREAEPVRPQPASRIGVPSALPMAGRSVMEPATTPEGSRTLVNIIGWVIGGLLALLAVAAASLVILLQKPSTTRTVTTPSPAETVVATPTKAESPGTQPTRPSPSPVAATPTASEERDQASERVDPSTKARVEEWPDAVARMESTVAALRSSQSDAVERFRRAYAELSRGWCNAAPDQRTRAVNAVIDAIFAAAGSPEQGDRVLAVLAASGVAATAAPASGEVLPAVWTSGIVARLSRERELPRGMVRRIDELAASLFGQAGVGEATFESGVASEVLAMTQSLVPLEPRMEPETIREREAAWRRWVEACRAAGDGAFFTRTVLVALDRLLAVAPEPTRDESVFQVVTDLVCAITWRQDDASRAWLLAKFDSAAVSEDDLHVVTAALATRSGAPGVDATMVLGQGASSTDRAKLREQYASVWAVKPPASRQAVFAKWIEAARKELDRTDIADDPFAHAAEAVAMARLCEGAWLLDSHVGGEDDAQTQGDVELLLLDVDRGLAKRLASLVPAASKATIDPKSTEWAVRYAAAQQKITERLNLLSSCSETPTAVEARIIVDEACRGSPEKIQAAAQAAVRRLASSPAIVAALLDEAPFIPQTGGNTELLRAVVPGGRIPAPKDASWRVAVRRVLVERLLEVLAGDGVVSIADAVGDALAESYAARLPRGGAAATNLGAEEAAERLFAATLLRARAIIPTGREPVSVSAVLSSRAARERLASGRVQKFAAEQTSLCELLAYLVASERPNDSGAVGEVLAEFASNRQKSQHVLSQIHAAEHAMLRLWLIRMDDQKKGGAS